MGRFLLERRQPGVCTTPSRMPEDYFSFKRDPRSTSPHASRSPQEIMNEYLSDSASPYPEQLSDDQGERESDNTSNYAPKSFPYKQDDEDNDVQEYTPGYHHIAPVSTSYIPQYTDTDTPYLIQEVIPNAQMAVSSSGGSGATSGFRSRAATRASRSNTIASNSAAPMQPRASNDIVSVNSDSAGRGGSDENDPHIHNVPMMVKPKTLYQNPQTPTVLPSTYHPINKWSTVKYNYLKEFLAEFIGTMMMIIFGSAVVCQVRLSQQQQKNIFSQKLIEANLTNSDVSMLQYLVTPDPGGNFDNIALGWAGAVVMGYFSAGGSAISGAHLNPALTLSNCIFRGFPWKKVPYYLMGQMLGAYVGALIIFIYYKRVIQEVFIPWTESETVLSMFCVVPQSYLSSSRQFVGEYVITAILQCCIFALTDPYTCLSSDLFPLMLFVLIYCLNASLSLQTGAAMNMARDLGPRLALYTVGMDRHLLWETHNHFFWVPIVAPFIGAFTGAMVYDLCIYQGHESPVNLPLTIYKEALMRFWIRRPGWKKRTRNRATSSVSGWMYDDDNVRIERHSTEDLSDTNKDLEKNQPPSQEQIPKTVQFKSVSRKVHARNPSQGIPTIFEEDDDDDDDDDDGDDDDYDGRNDGGDSDDSSLASNISPPPKRSKKPKKPKKPKKTQKPQRRPGIFKKLSDKSI